MEHVLLEDENTPWGPLSITWREGGRKLNICSEPPGTCVCLAGWACPFQVVLVVKNLPANAGGVRDSGSILGWGRFPGGGHGNPLQYSCLENPTDRGAWWASVYGVAQSWT